MLKLGIKWDNDTYIDSAVVFGWVHEAVSSIPTCQQHRHAYIVQGRNRNVYIYL